VQPVGMAACGSLLELLGLVRLYWAMGGGMLLGAVAALASRGYRTAELPQASNVRRDE
jgi:ABC-type sugar transport system substrate-binding protein